MKFSVTTEDIERSWRVNYAPKKDKGELPTTPEQDVGAPAGCPVAQAIRRVIGPKPLIAVGQKWITIGRKAWPTPIKVTGFVGRFDSRKSVGPIEFELPDEITQYI